MWGRFDDNFPHHPKARRAGPEACWLFVCGVLHCNRFATDGFIDALDLDVLYPHAGWSAEHLAALAARLVEVGLWERAKGGWQIHDYADYQREAMKDARDERRKWEAERKAKQRAAKRAGNAPLEKQGSGDDCPSGTGVGQSHGTGVGHVPGTPVGHDAGASPRAEGVTDASLSQAPVPSRPDPIQEEILSLAPAAPATVTPKSSREKKPAADPPPFALGEAFEALAAESHGRFVTGVERDWTKGVRISVAKAIRAYPDLALWRRLGRWLAAGGDAFRGSVGPAWAASAALSDAMARAAAWEAQGGAPIPARGVAPLALSAAPARPAAPVETINGPRLSLAEQAVQARAFRASLANKETAQ